MAERAEGSDLRVDALRHRHLAHWFPLDVFANLNTTRTDTGNGNAGNYYFNPANFSAARLNNLDQIARHYASRLPGFTYGTFPRNAPRGPGFTKRRFGFGQDIQDS
jgi:hypothetical protein